MTKRLIITGVVLFAFFLSNRSSAFAAHPGYGLHEYGWGSSELVLEQDLAYYLAANLYRSPYDPISQNVIRQIVNRSATWGGRLVPIANLASMFLNGAMSATQQQMKLTASVKNYEAYGFKMMWGQPYWCVTYSFNDGTLLRERSSPHVYVVFGDALFYVNNASYFNWDWNQVTIVPDGRLRGWFPYPKAGTLLKESSKAAVWIVEWGQKDPRYTLVSPSTQWGWVRRQLSYAAFVRLRLDWGAIHTVPDGAFNNPYIPRGYDIL